MNKKSVFSTVGLFAIAVGLIVVVALISVLPGWRVDLTEDGLFSLSDGTKNIVSNLSEPMEVMFFYSDSATEDAPQIRTYATRVQELLQEIVIASNGNLRLTVIDPEPFSEDEDLATQYGIQAVPVTQGGEGIYFGLVVRREEGDAANPVFETMPLIRPDQEQFLEYEFMKLISKVEDPDLTVVGLITSLDIDGGYDPMAGQATPAWMIMDYVRQLYQVRRLNTDIDQISDDIDILMVIHPQGLTNQALYAIDQYVMSGGETMVFLDPSAESMISRMAEGNLIPAGTSSELPRLLESWGVSFDNSKVLVDSDLALRVRMGQDSRPMPHLAMLGVKRPNMNPDDIITSRLESINLSTVGAIAPLPDSNITFEPLMESSNNSMLMDRSLVEDADDPSVLFDEFEATPENYVIAARVTGNLESAFPDGRPAPPAPEAEESTTDEDGTAQAEATEETAEEATEEDAEEATEAEEFPAHIASSQGTANILLFADTDLLTDRMWVQIAQFLGQRIPQPFANNGDLLINALDNMSGGADLVSIRSRGRYSRPFTRVLDLQREADDRLRVEEAELLDRMAETEAQLAQLNTDENGQPIGQVTPEIQAEIDGFNNELLQTRRRLRDVRYQLTEDIERLGSNLKAINTALIPALLTILMLFAHYTRTRRRKTGS